MKGVRGGAGCVSEPGVGNMSHACKTPHHTPSETISICHFYLKQAGQNKSASQKEGHPPGPGRRERLVSGPRPRLRADLRSRTPGGGPRFLPGPHWCISAWACSRRMYNYELSESHSTWFQPGGPPSSQLKDLSPPGIRWPFDGQTRLSRSLILSRLLQPRKRGGVGGCYSAGMTTPMAEDGRVRAPPSLTVTGSLGTPAPQGDEGMELQRQAAGRLRGEGASLRSRNAGIDRAAAETRPWSSRPQISCPATLA